MSELEMNNSTGSINGIKFDFRGYNAELTFSGRIVKVTCIKTGKDCTSEFKKKYNQ